MKYCFYILFSLSIYSCMSIESSYKAEFNYNDKVKLLNENKSLKKGGKTAKAAIIKSSNTHDIDNFKLVIEEAESEDIKELRPLLDEKRKM